MPTAWDGHGVAQCERKPPSRREAAALYHCATCCLAEAGEPPDARHPNRETLTFWGLPAFVEHCMGSQHMMLARAWCKAKQSHAVRGKAGLVKAARAAVRQALATDMHTATSAAAGRLAPMMETRAAVQAQAATLTLDAGPGAAEPAGVCGALAQAPGAPAVCTAGPGSTPVAPHADTCPQLRERLNTR